MIASSWVLTSSLLWLALLFHQSSASYYGYHGSGFRNAPLASASIIPAWRRQRSRRSFVVSPNDVTATTLALRIRKRNKDSKTDVSKHEEYSPAGPPEDPFGELGPVGKTIAGVTEIVTRTLMDYCSGFIAGLFFGTIVGAPGFMFRSMEPGVRQTFSKEMAGRFARMNARSMTWAKSYGGISSAFGCFDTTLKVVRNGKKDKWTDILSSAAAGAFFARKEGPQAMLKGAITYGGLIYLVSGGFNRSPAPLAYEEKEIEF